ncbi:unnamed protein product [Brassica oleracea var. botrytis]
MLTLRLKLEFLLVINHLRNATFICLRVLLLELNCIFPPKPRNCVFLPKLRNCIFKEEISLVDVLNMKLQNTGSS